MVTASNRLALLLVFSAAVAAGCTAQSDSPEGASNTTTPSSPTASATPTTPPDDAQETPEELTPTDIWTRALDTSEQVQRVDMEAQIITNVEGFERITQGEGYVDIADGFGDLTWRDDRSTTREVRSPDGHFVELDGTWFEVPSGLPTTVAFDPLAGLGSPLGVTVEGNEDVDGTPTTKMIAEIDPASAPFGFSDEETTVFDAASGSLVATLWVDDQDRVVRILREYSTFSDDGDPVEGISLYLLEDPRSSAPIDVPQTADAIPAPA